MRDSREPAPLPEKNDNSFRGTLLFGLLFGIVISFQVGSGAWESDFGKHADEGAHVVTSLMVRDYLAGGWREQWHPMRYAEAYYERFPKVAIGHYPPGFYLVAAAFLLLARVPEVLLILLALLATFAGWQTWRMGRRWLDSDSPALVAGVLFCVLPLVRSYTAIVMADLLLVVFGLLALDAWIRFREKPSFRRSITFGCWAAAAILAKGSALSLGLLPPLAILLGRQWALLRDLRLWVAAVPVVVFAFPWYWLTQDITAEGMQDRGPVEYFGEAAPYYFFGLGREMSWIVLVAALGWAGASIFAIVRKKGSLDAYASDLLAFCLGTLLLICLIPTGLDHRYLMPVVPVMILLGVGAVWWIVKGRGKGWEWGGMAVFAFFVLFSSWRSGEKRYTGAGEAVAAVLSASRENGGDPERRKKLLIVSDAKGEGALTAAAAFRGRDRLHVLRGTKTLAGSDWMGRDYVSRVPSRDDFKDVLREEGVGFVILEKTDGATDSPAHWLQSENYLSESGTIGKKLAEVDSIRSRGRKSSFTVYRINLPKPGPGGTEPSPPGAARADRAR